MFISTSYSCHFEHCTVDNDVGVRSVAVGDAPLFFASENYPNKYSNDETLDQRWTFTTTTSGLAVQITVLTALLEKEGDRCVDGLKFQDGMFSVSHSRALFTLICSLCERPMSL